MQAGGEKAAISPGCPAISRPGDDGSRGFPDFPDSARSRAVDGGADGCYRGNTDHRWALYFNDNATGVGCTWTLPVTPPHRNAL